MVKTIDKPVLINYIIGTETTKRGFMKSTKQTINSDPTKFYTVSVFSVYGDETACNTLSGICVTLGDAAEKVAEVVNETLAFEHKKKRVKATDCTTGYTLKTDDGKRVITITEHERPWAVIYMDCDNMQHTVDLFPGKESAEAAVSEKAKAGIKNLGHDKPEYIYADRNGECEITSKQIKKQEAYIKVDTIGGNHIDWTAKQI